VICKNLNYYKFIIAAILGMLVEVVATEQPKANLAIGQLLGKF
jgi:hypothetical protein